MGNRSVDNYSFPPVAMVRSSGEVEAIQVEGRLNGKATMFVLDSGANRTLVHSDLLPNTSFDKVPGGLSNVTGRRNDLYGPTEVCLEINGITI